jgi:hypothetical protein
VIVMKSMELGDHEKSKLDMPVEMPTTSEYPYGLNICLTDRELAILDLDPEDACIGGIVHMHALARITAVSINSGKDGKRCRVELTLENLAIESEDAEAEEVEEAEESM